MTNIVRDKNQEDLQWWYSDSFYEYGDKDLLIEIYNKLLKSTYYLKSVEMGGGYIKVVLKIKHITSGNTKVDISINLRTELLFSDNRGDGMEVRGRRKTKSRDRRCENVTLPTTVDVKQVSKPISNLKFLVLCYLSRM